MAHSLFHRTLKFLKDHGIQNQKIIAGVSGGLDSMTLLNILSELSTPLRLTLSAVYVHHGPTAEKEIKTYRDRAERFVSQACLRLCVPCVTSAPPKKALKTEADFREFRRGRLKEILTKQQARWLALGHHSGDVLETRLIHLIRGCGEKGLLFPPVSPPWLRPFVEISRAELEDYAKIRQIQWLEDPGNRRENFFRNWLRQSWLPALEKQRPGSRKTLARSFSRIAEGLKASEDFSSLAATKNGIRRTALLELEPSRQKAVLAGYMREKEIKNYGQSHIQELLKHLERRQKNFTLRLLKRTWRVTENLIFVEDDTKTPDGKYFENGI